MTKVLTPPNHVALLIAYLTPFFVEGVVRAEEPDTADYDPESLLILVKDAGQSSPVAHTFWDCMTGLEVRHGDRSTAYAAAGKVDALLRVIPDSNIHYHRSLNSPQYDPEPEHGVPAYTWAIQYRVRGQVIEL